MKIVSQLTFQRGIVENIKQDSFAEENGYLPGALYLENYNPNIEYKSLIKRYGIITHYPTFNKYFDIHPKPSSLATYCDGVIPYAMDNRDYGTDKTGKMAKNPVIGIKHILTSLPNYNDTIALFLSRLDINLEESTAVTGFVIEYNDSEIMLSPRWIEPWSYKNLEIDELVEREAILPLDNAGWWVYGTMKDVTRLGNQLAFVTKIQYTDYDDFFTKEKLYPCYLWGLWDISKKREEDARRYWNGIDLVLSKDKHVRWRVGYPSLEVIGDVINVKTCYTSSGVFAGGYEFLDQATDAPVTDSDFNVIFQQQPMATANQIIHDQWKPDAYKPFTLEHNDANSGFRQKNKYLTETFGFTAGAPYCEIISNVLMTHEVINLKWWEEKLLTEGEYVIANGTLGRLDTWSTPYTPETDTIKVACNNQSGDLPMFGRRCGLSLLTQALIDYNSAKIPRPWIGEEKIPYLITLVMDGVEYLLHKDIYIVKEEVGVDIGWTYATGHKLTIANPGFYDASGDPGYCVDTWKTDPKQVAADLNVIVTPVGWPSLNVPERYYYRATGFHKASPQITCDYVQSAKLEIKLNHMIKVTIRLKKTLMEKLMAFNATEIKFYVSEGDSENHLVKYWGCDAKTEAEGLLYALPAIKDITAKDLDYTKFRLVNTFVIEGTGAVNENDDYSTYDQTLPTYMNGWKEVNDGVTDWVYAVPQEPNKDAKTTLNDMLDDGINKLWTPNFILWDYPVTSALSLSGSGEYWKGKGAEFICAIKGRIFLDNTFDENGNLEQGITRYSLYQNGNFSKDTFYKEDYIRTGHLPCTGFIEYREQLWKFNRESFYRIALNEIAMPETWEFLDAQHGAGNLGSKTVCTTPMGVAFCNEKGIWISDGRIPTCLTDNFTTGLAVTSLYQKLMLNSSYVYVSANNPGEVVIGDKGFNEYAELIYDEYNNELVLITPVIRNDRTDDYNVEKTYGDTFTDELRLIYSFSSQNWRVEQIPNIMPEETSWSHPTEAGLIRTHSNIHRTHFASPKIYTFRYYPIYEGNFTTLVNYPFELGIPDYRSLLDVFFLRKTADIYAKLLSHEIGNGYSDYLLQQIILEAIPREDYSWVFDEMLIGGENSYQVTGWQSWDYSSDNDPKLYFETRTRNADYQLSKKIDDLIAINMAVKGGTNPFINELQSPLLTGDEDFDGSPYVARESLILISPLWTKYRKLRLKIVSKIIATIRSLTVKQAEHQRRTF